MRASTLTSMLAVGGMLWLGVADLSAQRHGGHRGPGFQRGPGLEMMLSARERLDLDEQQVAELNDLREQMVALRSSHRTAMEQMRSRVRAGDMEGADMRAAMEQMRSSGGALRDEVRQRVEDILDEDQKATWDEIRRERRSHSGRGAARGWRGHGTGGPASPETRSGQG